MRYCRTSHPDALFAEALLMTWSGWIHHYTDTDPTPLEQGIQLLTKCTSHYFGTEKGAICSV